MNDDSMFDDSTDHRSEIGKDSLLRDGGISVCGVQVSSNGEGMREGGGRGGGRIQERLEVHTKRGKWK